MAQKNRIEKSSQNSKKEYGYEKSLISALCVKKTIEEIVSQLLRTVYTLNRPLKLIFYQICKVENITFHEFGHYFLHQHNLHKQKDYFHRPPSLNSLVKEAQANLFSELCLKGGGYGK